MSSDEAPKLHIDSDWKAEAQAEKERLAEKEKEAGPAEGGAGAAGLPEADFRALIGMLAYQAMAGLGGAVDPQSGKAMVDPEGARFVIDLLGVLEEKTKGNLTDEESGELTQVLAQLRSQFVQIMQALAAQQAGAAPIGDGPDPNLPPISM